MNKLHLILPVVAGFAAGNASALEVVAQSPVGGGSAFGAANLANTAKVEAVKAEAAQLKQKLVTIEEKLEHVTGCAAEGKVWDGNACVAINGQAGRDGRDGTQITIPACTTSQTLVSHDGKTLECRNVSDVGEMVSCFEQIYSATIPGFYSSDASMNAEYISDGEKNYKAGKPVRPARYPCIYDRSSSAGFSCASGWRRHNCHGNSGLDCCVKLE